MTDMKNLEITVHLKSPMILGSHELNLDSLCYWSAFLLYDDDHEKAMEAVRGALASEHDIFKSSNLIYLQSPNAPVSAKTVSFTSCFNWGDFPLSTDKSSISELGGPYRSRLTTYDALSAQAVKFYAKGDEAKLNFLLNSLGGIGKNNNQGYGEIGEILIDTVDQDKSWYAFDEEGNAKLHRNLPLSVVSSIDDLSNVLSNKVTTLIKCYLPYTSSKGVEGFATNLMCQNVNYI